MGRKTPENKHPDYSRVIQIIEHYLQHGTDTHPDENHEEAARSLESGDAQRALVEIGAAMDRAKR